MYRNNYAKMIIAGILKILLIKNRRWILLGLITAVAFISINSQDQANTYLKTIDISKDKRIKNPSLASNIGLKDRDLPILKSPPDAFSENEAWAIYQDNPNAAGIVELGAGDNSVKDLINGLSMLRTRHDWVLTPDDAAEISKTLQQIVQQGDAAVPAIFRFLKSMDDVDFQAFKGGDKIGFGSLRLALLDALHRIGGKQAKSIFFKTLKMTTVPLEIATLGRYLNENAAGKYNKYIVDAARRALTLASDNGINGKDVGPLFEVFQNYGNESVAALLEQVSQLKWGQYASVTLAKLPEGKGIPGLVRMVRNAPQTNLGARFALQMLAQSAEYPEAQMALIDSIHEDQIPDELWPEFAQMITGAYRMQLEDPRTSNKAGTHGLANGAVSVEKHVSFTPGGGQVLYGVHYATANVPAEQIEQRLQLIETLLSETSNPVVSQVLNQAYDRLHSVFQTSQP